MNLSLHSGPSGLPSALATPEGQAPSGGWPLLLFLHGAGERGADQRQVRSGLYPAVLEAEARWPALIAMPQCPEGRSWSGANSVEDAVVALLDQLEAEHETDPERLYLTGLSMGGHGSWSLACRFPQRFAAVVPICGGGDSFAVMRNLGKMPIWSFHGSADSVIPVGSSRALVDSLARAGNQLSRHTEYPGVGHACWDMAYRELGLAEWIFSHRRAAD